MCIGIQQKSEPDIQDSRSRLGRPSAAVVSPSPTSDGFGRPSTAGRRTVRPSDSGAIDRTEGRRESVVIHGRDHPSVRPRDPVARIPNSIERRRSKRVAPPVSSVTPRVPGPNPHEGKAPTSETRHSPGVSHTGPTDRPDIKRAKSETEAASASRARPDDVRRVERTAQGPWSGSPTWPFPDRRRA